MRQNLKCIFDKKKSSYASNKIEGNPLTEKQANEAIDSDPHKHFLKPEQEVRNYFLASQKVITNFLFWL